MVRSAAGASRSTHGARATTRPSPTTLGPKPREIAGGAQFERARLLRLRRLQVPTTGSRWSASETAKFRATIASVDRVYIIFVGRQMWLLLMLFWCSAGVRQCGGPDILRYNSRFGAFNSGLCWREFAIRGIAGIWRQWLDLVRTVGGRAVIAKDKALKCLSRWEKPGSSAGTDRGR